MFATIRSFISFLKKRSKVVYEPIHQLPWVEKYNPYFINGFSISYIILMSATVIEWQFFSDSKSIFWLFTKFFYFIWTIAVPMWMFLEVVWGFELIFPYDEKYPVYKEELAALKVKQDAARPVWAGAAAALGILLLKVGGG